jgi:GxxExxY protein
LEKNEFKHKDLTEKIIGAAYTVHNKLGFGFLEKVYHNSLLIELDSLGIIVESEVPIKVYYREKVVGEYFA